MISFMLPFGAVDVAKRSEGKEEYKCWKRNLYTTLQLPNHKTLCPSFLASLKGAVYTRESSYMPVEVLKVHKTIGLSHTHFGNTTNELDKAAGSADTCHVCCYA